jgi:hypothetical protein
LRSAITAAGEKSPSSTKRVVVVVPPGQYNLDGTPLSLTEEYVDLVGLTTDRDSQYIYLAFRVSINIKFSKLNQ